MRENSVFDTLDQWLRKAGEVPLVAGTISVLALLGYLNRFLQDDAYISFRYAANWVDGYGLTWNPGQAQAVEGYTNFLWVLAAAVPEKMGMDISSHTLWNDYVNFLKSVDAAGSYLENQKIAAIRKVYQRGIVNPMIHIEQLWYDD